MEFKDILIRLLPGRRDNGCRARNEGGVMVVECGGCEEAPDPASDRCIGCMVRNLASCGPADEVVLRNGNDLGVCGESGRFLAEAASLMKWSVPDPPADRGCSGCSLSPDKIMGRAWEDFPGDSIGYAKDMLDWECPEREGCDGCRESTRRSLDSLESDLRDLASRMVSP